MRLELLQAVGLVASLHLAGPLVAPTQLAPSQLAEHLGQRVALEGRVADVQIGEEVHEVTLARDGETVRVLSRAPPPPLGARVEVVGDAASGKHGPVLWTDGPWTILSSPDREPRSVDRVAREAPELAGSTVAVVGRWDPDREVLVGDEARLEVRLLAGEPTDEEIVAWGVLDYRAERATYRLDATGWEPWTGPQP